MYAPNEDCPHFIEKIAALVADKGEGLILIGGDFNCVLNHKLDRLPTTMRPQSKMSKSVSNMMEELGLVEIWCHFHPRYTDYTFMSRVHGSYSRIDYFLISKNYLYRIKDSTIGSISISDHSPIIFVILCCENKFRGRQPLQVLEA